MNLYNDYDGSGIFIQIGAGVGIDYNGFDYLYINKRYT